MDELVRWLGEQLDEDERIARAVEDRSAPWDGQWVADGNDAARTYNRHVLFYGHNYPLKPGLVAHVVEHDPARVLREIEADRELLRQYAEVAANDVDDVEYAHGWANALGLAVRLRATAYRDRPGYRGEEWVP
jgi:hypothetical protein